MKVLIVGSGGREHAIAASVAKSKKVDKIYCAPGNAGIGQIAECVPIGAMEFDKITAFAKEKAIDLTIVGMDDPLVGGLIDELESAGLRAFGHADRFAIYERQNGNFPACHKFLNNHTAARGAEFLIFHDGLYAIFCFFQCITDQNALAERQSVRF